MSGGHLVVLDRLGRDVKRYPLPSGLATLGSSASCDIRIMQSTVSDHHATVIVRAHQTMIRNVSDGQTLLNGQPISVSGLQHGDAITVGDRTLRWEYDQPASVKSVASQPAAVYVKKGKTKATRGRSRASEASLRRMDPTVQLMLEMSHRASMPGKQVAVVQPQRRDLDYTDSTPRLVIKPHRPFPQSSKRQRVSKTESPKPSPPLPDRGEARRKTASPKADLTTTKATMWIESRKSTPRKTVTATPPPASPRRSTPRSASLASSTIKRAPPLRTVVLRRTMTPAVKPRSTPVRVDKIQAPTELDPTKQAALMLMTGRTPKSKLQSPTATPSPSFLVKRPSPVRKTPKSAKKTPKSVKKSKSPPSAQKTPPAAQKWQSPAIGRKTPTSERKTTAIGRKRPTSERKSLRSANNTPLNTQSPPSANEGAKVGRQSRKSQAVNEDETPRRLSGYEQGNKSVRTSRSSAGKFVTILEISDTDRRSRATDNTQTSPISSPTLASPRKSALKDPTAKNTSRKNESIKFDLSNLENENDQSDVFILSSTSRGKSLTDYSDEDLTLHYSEKSNSLSPNPSPRRSIHSRSSRILEKSLGTPLEAKNYTRTLTPESPTPRKSVRGSLMVQKALETSLNDNTRYSSRTTKSLDGNLTRTLSPRSSKSKLERYSIVDLISFDSNDSRSSDYNSARSTRTTFATPDNRRKTRSLIDTKLVSASTPFNKTGGNTSRRSKSLSTPKSVKVSVSSKRSSSLSTPENTKLTISINSTRISRLSRRTANDSDLLIVSPGDDVSPKTSKRTSRSTFKSLDMSSGSKSSPNASRQSPKSANSSRQSARTLNNSSQSSASPNTTKSPNISRQSPKSANTTRLSTRSNASKSSPTSANVSKTSPKSARQSPKSPNTSKQSPKSNSSRRSGRNLTLTIGPSGDGLHTPENRYSPEEASTPVLSIQSLLDSSHSSLLSQVSNKRVRLSVQPSRRTIGGLRSQPKRGRSSAKSKSFYLGSSRKSLLRRSNDSSEISDKTDEGAPKTSNEDNITPKSTVKLVQEGVKNKHSTEKKPQSKRSIIDNLNESLLVKDLFNSPVKRKLSQSMTEFSRTQLFDDEPVVGKRTRNTTALTGRSPNRSLLDRSENFTPEVFVSPLTTPENSPNVSGLKKLFRKNTPQNDLSNVKGVKRLLRTPRARKSVKNDLTNVGGVKNVFAKSPRNSLTNVSGVKNVFTSSPKNDLRRVTGVKSLFQPQRKGKSPKNDLSDVRGVRKLYQKKTPDNDLRNVSGVKKGLTVRSPRNDLTDVRGVKRLFTRDKSRAVLSDVSGIEELFNLSTNSGRNSRLDASASEILFDQAFGKPKVKATYARSFTAKTAQKQKEKRPNKSLDTSFEILTNASSWLQKEAQKRKKTASPKAQNKSLNKSKMRELQKLLTDTVEGTEPLQKSRTRISTLIQSIPDTTDVRKSNSALYEKTLPIKKRSFVEASLEKSASSSKVLPIKKRVLVHSTPVKGKWNLTANVSELGRVSPIAAEKTSNEAETTIRSTAKLLSSPKSKPVSPKVTRARQSKVNTPKPANQPKSAARSTRASRASKAQTPAVSPKATREKKTNVKNVKGNLAITLTSPRLNPVTNSPKLTVETPKKVTKSPNVSAKTLKSPRVANKSPKVSPQSPKTPKSPKVANKTKTPRAVAKKAPKQPKASPRPTKAAEKSIKSPNSPRVVAKKAPKSPVKSKKSPVKSKKSPVKAKKSPVKAKKSPMKTKKSPVKAKESPVKAQRSTRAGAKKSPMPSPKPPKPAAAKATKKSQKAAAKSPKVARSTRAAPKSPLLTPKPTATKQTRKGRNAKDATPKPVTPKLSAKKTRATKTRTVEEKLTTPKTRRGKISKNATLIIAKASPQIKPQSVEATKRKQATKTVAVKSPPKRARNKVESPPEATVGKRRGKPVEKVVTLVKKGRKAQEIKSKETPVKRTRGRQVEVIEANTSVKEKLSRGRKRKSDALESEVPAKNPRRGTSTETKGARGKKASPNKSKSAQNKAQISKTASVENTKEVKSARGRKNQSAVETTTKGRKRKSDEVTTSRGSAKKAAPSKSQKGQAKPASPVKAIRTRRQDKTIQASTLTSTRSKRR